MKNKIIGIVNLFFGIINILLFIGLLQAIFKMNQLYADLGVPSSSRFFEYWDAGIIVIMIVANIFFSIKNLTKSKYPNKYFILGLICALLTFFIGGAVVSFLTFAIINPLYYLPSQP